MYLYPLVLKVYAFMTISQTKDSEFDTSDGKHSTVYSHIYDPVIYFLLVITLHGIVTLVPWQAHSTIITLLQLYPINEIIIKK